MKKKLISLLLPLLLLASGLCVCMAGFACEGFTKDPVAAVMQRIKGVEDNPYEEDPYEDPYEEDPSFPEDTEPAVPTDGPAQTAVPTDTLPSPVSSAEPQGTDAPEGTSRSPEGSSAPQSPATGTASPETTKQPPVTTQPPPVTTKPTPATTATPVTQPVPDYRDRDVNSPDYFKDALFVGDSRMHQLFLYAPIEGADCYGDSLMRIDNLWNVREIDSLNNRKTDLETYLKAHSYRKIYLMEGVNELSGRVSTLAARYREVSEKILELQPSAIVVLVSIFHTSRWRDKQPDAISNWKINEMNAALAALADNDRIFYMDVSTLYDDAGGYFSDTYTKDGVHPYAKYYGIFRDFILTKGKY